MSNLFSIVPLRQQVDIFSKWLTLRYVCIFDTAVCETFSRAAFLSLLWLNGMNFSIGVGQYELKCKPAIDWLICRKMQVASIVLFSTLVTNHDLRRLFFSVCGHSLQSVTFPDNHMQDLRALYYERKDNLPERNTSSTAQIMFDIADVCSNLQVLSLHCIVVDGSMCVLLKGCPHLKEINCTHCGGINCAVLAALCTYSLKLQIFDVTESQFFLPVAGKLLTSLHCSSLVQFKAAGTNLTSTQSVALMSVFANLTELELGTLSEEELLSIVVAQPHMQSFKAQLATQLTSKAATMLSKLWREIVQLRLQLQPVVMSDATLMILIAECTTLYTLQLGMERDVKPCESNHDDSKSNIIQEGHSALRYLHVQNIAPYTFQEIIKACPHLQHFTITHATPDDDDDDDDEMEDETEADKYPFEWLEGKQVHYLALSNCANVTDSCIDKLSHLTHFSIKRSPKVTDAAIIELAERCPLLNTLNVSECVKTSAELLVPVADGCPQLRDLSFCLAAAGEIENEGSGVLSEVVEDLLRRIYPHIKRVWVSIT